MRNLSPLGSTSSCSSVNESFWRFHVSAWVLRNSATAFVTVDFTGDGSPTKRASNVTCSGNQLNKQKKLLLVNGNTVEKKIKTNKLSTIQ